MISRRSINNFIWIDLVSPSESEVREVADEYKLEYFTARDLSSPTPKPRVRAYESGKYICAVLHIPAFKHSHIGDAPQEIDIIIGRNVLITARYESIDAFNTFEKESDVQNILGKTNSEYKNIALHLLQEIQNCLFDEIAFIEDWVGFIEDGIFSGKQKGMVTEISQVSKNILNFKKTLKPQRDILIFLNEEGGKRFGKLFEEGTKDLIKSWERLDESIANNFEMLLELRATNDSILSTGQNEVMKTLTILAFVTFPLSLIAAVFGMNASSMPIVGGPHDFWMILGIMFTATLSMFVYFKYKKWI